MSDLMEIIKGRKSVRSFDGRLLSAEDKEKLTQYAAGIALCHFVSGAEERGMAPSVTVTDPGIALPEKTFYIATVTL